MTASRLVLARAAERLQGARLPSPMADARALLSFVTGQPLTRLDLLDVTGEDVDRFEALVERRATGVPVQHLTGSTTFRWVDLEVGPGVFVPRPETELVAQAAIDAARRVEAPVVVDLCTGSGAIAASIAQEVPAARVSAVELSEEALPWARRNLDGTGVTLVAGDIRDALHALDGAVDVVVCNPPYVPSVLRDGLPGDVVGVDPDLALFAGEDGLALMPAVVATASRLLVDGGTVVIEHAEEHGPAMAELLGAGGAFGDGITHDDLTGRPRFTTAVRTRGPVQG